MKSGDTFCYSDNRELVSALLALGIKLLEDAPYFYRIQNGVEIVVWNLEDRSPDGQFNTPELIKAYATDGWFESNPWHPFTIAVHSQQNNEQLKEWIDADIPYATFPLGDGRELHAKLGSNDYAEAISKGLKPL